jgi:hypothetical protein
MKRLAKGAVLFLSAGLVLLVGLGCGGDDSGQGQGTDPKADVEHAQQLWPRIQEYPQWNQPAGLEGWQRGTAPHGKFVKYYANKPLEELETDGAIIVKENYTAEMNDALDSITVMEKRKGYDPETGDWFYAKYNPKGDLEESDQGKMLAGLVGKGTSKGCLPCHAKAQGGDYLFLNDN